MEQVNRKKYIVNSGFQKLDNLISGFFPGEITLIGGRVSMGKTSFILSLIKNISVDKKVTTAFLSEEDTDEGNTELLLSNICNIDKWKIRKKSLSCDELKKIDEVSKILDDAPLLYLAREYNDTLSVFINKLEKVIRQKDVKILFIDSLDRTILENYSNSRNFDFGRILFNLKNLAKRCKIHIIITHFLPFKNVDSYPCLEDFEGLNHYTDNTLSIYRPDVDRPIAHTDDSYGFCDVCVLDTISGNRGCFNMFFEWKYKRLSESLIGD